SLVVMRMTAIGHHRRFGYVPAKPVWKMHPVKDAKTPPGTQPSGVVIIFTIVVGAGCSDASTLQTRRSGG
ncbi:MAG: hypothetical protein WB710_19590, partial [Stellaceae bacterium]